MRAGKLMLAAGMLGFALTAQAQSLSSDVSRVRVCEMFPTLVDIQLRRTAAGQTPLPASGHEKRYLQVLHEWTTTYTLTSGDTPTGARAMAFSKCIDNIDRLIREDQAGFATLEIR